MARLVPAVAPELSGNLAAPNRTLGPVVRETAEALQHHDAESPNVDNCGVCRFIIDLGCQVSTRTTQRLKVVALLRKAKVSQLHVDAVFVSMFHEDVRRADVSMHDGRLARVKAIQRRQTLVKDFGALLGCHVVVSVERPARKIFETEARQVSEILT